MTQAQLPWTLFVKRGETHSEQAIASADPLTDRITVVDVEGLRRGDIVPSWLTGVPTLLDRETWTMYKGSVALKKLDDMRRQGPYVDTTQDCNDEFCEITSKPKVSSEDVQRMLHNRQKMEPVVAPSGPVRSLSPPITDRA